MKLLNVYTQMRVLSLLANNTKRTGIKERKKSLGAINSNVEGLDSSFLVFIFAPQTRYTLRWTIVFTEHLVD